MEKKNWLYCRIFTGLIFCMFVIAAIPSMTVHADTADDFVVENGVLTKYKGTDTEIVIPDNLGITKIGSGGGNTTLYNLFGGENTTVTKVTIPAGVTEIAKVAFYGCSGLKEVILSEGTTTIGAYAFRDCTSLEKVNLPTSLEKINTGGFYATKLKELTLPANLQTMGTKVFQECTSLTKVTFVDGIKLTAFGDYTFSQTGLKEIIIPEAVTKIGNYTFADCTDLAQISFAGQDVNQFGNNAFQNTSLQSFVLPDKLTAISDSLFEGCKELSSFSFGKAQITSIGSSAFKETKLSEIEIPDQVTSLGNSSFQSSSLSKIKLSQSLKSIGNAAFSDTLISAAELPETLITIGATAFNATELKEITIPASVTTMGANAFSNCAKLEKVLFAGEKCKTVQGTIYFPEKTVVYVNDTDTNNVEYCKANNQPFVEIYSFIKGGKFCMDLSKKIEGTEKTYTVSMDGGAAVSANQKYACDIPSDQDHLLVFKNTAGTMWQALLKKGYEDSSFDVEDGILKSYSGESTTLNVPRGVVSIGDGSSSVSTKVTAVNYSDTVTKLSANALKDCADLTELELFDGIDELYANSLSGTGIKKLNVAASVKKMDASAVANCSSLKLLYLSGNTLIEGAGLPDGITVYLHQSNTATIQYCNKQNIKYFVMEESVTDKKQDIILGGVFKINLEKIFDSAQDLTVSIDGAEPIAAETQYQLNVGENQTVINLVFAHGNEKYTVVLTTYDDGKSTVKDGALQKYDYGTDSEIEVPYGVTSINSTWSAPCFGQSKSIKKVTLPDTIEIIKNAAFRNCTNLKEINFPEGLRELESSAFYECDGLTKIELPKTLTTMASAFGYCDGLTEVDLSYVTSLNDSFSYCSSLRHVVLSDKLTEINGTTFRGDTALESIVIPGSVNTIGSKTDRYGAFAGCTSLKNVYFLDNPKRSGTLSLGGAVFAGCSSLQRILLPNDAEIIKGAIPDTSKIIYYRNQEGSKTETPIANIVVNGNENLLTFNQETHSYNVSVKDKWATVFAQVADGYDLSYEVVKDNKTEEKENTQAGALEIAMDGEGLYSVIFHVSYNDEPAVDYKVNINYTFVSAKLENVSFEKGELRTGKDEFSAGNFKEFKAEDYLYTVRIPGTLENAEVSFEAAANEKVYMGETTEGNKLLTPVDGASGTQYKTELETSDTAYLTVVKTEDEQEYQSTYTFKWYKINPSITSLGSVTEYKPAAGQFIKEFLPEVGQFDQIFNGYTSWKNYVSLGSFGGYMTIKCDEPVQNSEDNPYGVDFIAYGNAFAYGNGAGGEPAGVQVSKDGKNWYTLAGASHYNTTTKWNETAQLADGSTTKSVLIARMNENGVLNNVPGKLTPFGYADVHACSGNVAGDGKYEISGQAGNPYDDDQTDIGDAFDISWAVDEKGQPVYLDSIQYIRVQNVVDIYDDTFGENSPEIGAICAITNKAISTVGVTSTPNSITVNDKNYNTSQFEKKGNAYYIEDSLDTAATSVCVKVAASENTNIYVNNLRYTQNAEYQDALDAEGNHWVRIIAQEGTKEPVIYIMKLTGGDTSNHLIEKLEVRHDGALFDDLRKISSLSYTLNVKAAYDSVEVYPTVLDGVGVTVNGNSLKEGFVSVKLGNPGSDTDVKITMTKDQQSETAILKVHRMAYESTQPVTGKATISFEKFVLGQGYVKTPVQVTFNKGESVADITKRVLGTSQYQGTNSQTGFYLSDVKDPNRGSIKTPQYIVDALTNAKVNIDYTDLTPEWLGEFDYTSTSGWMISVNNEFIKTGSSACEVEDGDVIRWQFTLYGYGADIGAGSDNISQGTPNLKILSNKDNLTKYAAELGYTNVPQNIQTLIEKLDVSESEVKAAETQLKKLIDDKKTNNSQPNAPTTAEKKPTSVSVPVVKNLKLKSKTKRTMDVNWKKVSRVSGYQIQYSMKKNFKQSRKVTLTGASKNKRKLIKLKSKKKYYVRIRAYKKSNGTTYYGAWSTKKMIKVK